jgi:hypothetical protein
VLAAPAAPGAAAPAPARSVASSVTEYADAAAAAAAFAALAEGSAAALPAGATPVAGGALPAGAVPGTRVVGDASAIARRPGVDPGSGLPYRGLELVFRTGTLVAGVGVYDYAGGEPAVAEVEALAAVVLARIERVRAGGGPGLSPRALRLGAARPEAPGPVPVYEGYDRLGGATVPEYGESAEALAARAARLGEATDAYRVVQRLPAGTAAAGDDVVYASVLFRFADAAAAAAWLAGAEERLARVPGFTAVAPAAGAAAVGDESRAFAVDSRVGGEDARGVVVVARVGREVAQVRLFAPQAPPLALAEELAVAQAGCLRWAGRCGRLPVPAALTALTEGPSGVAGTTYASPAFGWRLAWDPAVWAVDEAWSRGGTDRLVLRLRDDTAVVAFSAFRGHGGDAARCIRQPIAFRPAQPGTTDVRVVAGPGGDAARSWVEQTYAYAEAGGRIRRFGEYAECRSLVPGEAVLVVDFRAPVAAYASRLPRLEGLLTAVVLPAAGAATPVAATPGAATPAP